MLDSRLFVKSYKQRSAERKRCYRESGSETRRVVFFQPERILGLGGALVRATRGRVLCFRELKRRVVNAVNVEIIRTRLHCSRHNGNEKLHLSRHLHAD